MKKIVFSALALVVLMTACHESETIVPRSAPTASTTATANVPVLIPGDDVIQKPVGPRQATVETNPNTPIATVGQAGITPQAAGRDGATGSGLVADNVGKPRKAVMPADTLAHPY